MRKFINPNCFGVTPYHESCYFQASVNAWANVVFNLEEVVWIFILMEFQRI
jgi:hypothetical protein